MRVTPYRGGSALGEAACLVACTEKTERQDWFPFAGGCGDGLPITFVLKSYYEVQY